jgi:isopenicillin N synthase-like dioxygenase
MTFLDTLKSLSCLGAKNSRRGKGPDQHHQNKSQTSQNGSASNSNATSSTAILPPLKATSLPHVLPLHQPALASQGWTTITSRDPLFEASQTLFRASKAFFALPSSYKEGFQTQVGTEEGWSRVDGEKEFITLRSLANTPPELKDAAITYWAEAGGLLNDILGKVAESLRLPADALTRFSDPCKELGWDRTATMLRLFRYQGYEGVESRLVAERRSQ